MKKVVKMPIKFLKKRAPFIVWFQQKTTQKELINMKTTNNFLHNLQVKLWQKTEKVAKDLSIKEKKFTRDRKSTRLNSSHVRISYAVFCLKKKKKYNKINNK